MQEKYSLDLGNHTLEYQLIRSAKRKSLSIEVHRDGHIRVRAPQRMPLHYIHGQLHQHQEWISQKWQQIHHSPRIPSLRFQEGEIHYFSGKAYTLRICHGSKEQLFISLNELVLISPLSLKPEEIQLRIEKWHRRQAQSIFQMLLKKNYDDFVQQGFHYPYPQLTIRKMRSRWGSMSNTGKMSLNLDLIRVPTRLLEYVILHELCHLKYHHHGKEFYQLLEKFMPDWQEHKKSLKAFANLVTI